MTVDQRFAGAHGNLPEIHLRISTAIFSTTKITGDMVMGANRRTAGGHNQVQRRSSVADMVQNGPRAVSGGAKINRNTARQHDKLRQIGRIR
jgi:hypothetical protein